MKECGHAAKRDTDSLYCHSCYMKTWRAKNRERLLLYQRANSHKYKQKYALSSKRWRIATKYNITLDEYDAIVQNPCGICGTVAKLRVLDHCHTTGAIRGALCLACNSRFEWWLTYREHIEQWDSIPSKEGEEIAPCASKT